MANCEVTNGPTDVPSDQCVVPVPSDESSKKCKIGSKMIAKIKKLTCNGTIKIPVKCNRFGKGVNKKTSTMQSYIGFLARRMISINYKTWKKVPNNTKTGIYKAIEVAFDMPSVLTEKMIIRSAGDKWKNFKCALGKLIVHEGVFRAGPPPQYSFIDQKSWEEFVQYRCTKEFQDLSNTNAEHAKQNNYPYKRSRKSIARLEYEENPETDSISRAELWKLGRQDHKGLYANEDTHQMAEKIDMYTEQVSQGTITLAPAKDVLTLALGKDDHYGRVRGVGFGVSKKTYFGVSKPKESASKQEVSTLRDEVAILKEKIAELTRHLMNQGSSQAQVSQPLNKNTSPTISNSHPQVEKRKELLKKCTLFWPDKEHEVAKGRAFIPQEDYTSVLHCQQLDSNQVLKVNLDTILPGCGAVSVPYPNDEVRCLSDPAGYIIGWPTALVVIESDSAQSSKANRSSGVEQMQVNINTSLRPPQQSDFVQGCVSLLSKNNRFVLEIPMEKEILQHSHTLFMGSDEVVTCLKHKKLEATHISFYMKFLYDRHKPSSHSFLCPSRLGAIRDKKGNIVQPKDENFDMRAIYLTSSIYQPNAVQRVWLAPYNGGNHWMLGMINPQLARVYWLDPLRGAPPPDFVKMCTTNVLFNEILF